MSDEIEQNKLKVVDDQDEDDNYEKIVYKKEKNMQTDKLTDKKLLDHRDKT